MAFQLKRWREHCPMMGFAVVLIWLGWLDVVYERHTSRGGPAIVGEDARHLGYAVEAIGIIILAWQLWLWFRADKKTPVSADEIAQKKIARTERRRRRRS